MGRASGDLLANGVIAPRSGLPEVTVQCTAPSVACHMTLLLGVALTSRPTSRCYCPSVCGCRPPVWLALRGWHLVGGACSGFALALLFISMSPEAFFRCILRP